MASDSCHAFSWLLPQEHWALRVITNTNIWLCLLAFKQSFIFFLRFQKQEIPCARQWNLGLNISKTNCCFYKTSWSDGLLYGFFPCNSSLYRNCCEISKVPCLPFRLHNCIFIHFPKECIWDSTEGLTTNHTSNISNSSSFCCLFRTVVGLTTAKCIETLGSPHSP